MNALKNHYELMISSEKALDCSSNSQDVSNNNSSERQLLPNILNVKSADVDIASAAATERGAGKVGMTSSGNPEDPDEAKECVLTIATKFCERGTFCFEIVLFCVNCLKMLYSGHVPLIFTLIIHTSTPFKGTKKKSAVGNCEEVRGRRGACPSPQGSSRQS